MNRNNTRKLVGKNIFPFVTKKNKIMSQQKSELESESDPYLVREPITPRTEQILAIARKAEDESMTRSAERQNQLSFKMKNWLDKLRYKYFGWLYLRGGKHTRRNGQHVNIKTCKQRKTCKQSKTWRQSKT